MWGWGGGGQGRGESSRVLDRLNDCQWLKLNSAVVSLVVFTGENIVLYKSDSLFYYSYSFLQHLKVTFDGLTGRMKELSNLPSGRSIKLSQDVAFYKGEQGGFRSSGAYLFIPERELPQRVGGRDPVRIRVYKVGWVLADELFYLFFFFFFK